MALVYTLLVGGVIWLAAVKATGTRLSMGEGGPLVYLAVFLFVAVMTGRHASLLDRARADGRPPGSTLRSFGWALALAVVLVIGLALTFTWLGPLPGPGGTWLVGATFLGAAFGLAALVDWGRRQVLRGRGAARSSAAISPVRPDASRAVVALLPMLAPLLALLCLRWLPAGMEAGGWDGHVAPVGLVGILYLGLLTPFYPAALMVAWGIDRLDGSPTRAGARLVLGLAVVALTVGIVSLPEALTRALGPAPEREALGWLGRIVLPGPDPSTPFAYATGGGAAGVTRHPLPVASLLAGAPAMLLAAAGLTALALRRVGQGLRGLSGGAATALLLLQVAVTVALMPALGPEAAPWSAAGTCALGLLWVLGRDRRPVG